MFGIVEIVLATNISIWLEECYNLDHNKIVYSLSFWISSWVIKVGVCAGAVEQGGQVAQTPLPHHKFGTVVIFQNHYSCL